jgi:hypothetical protein
MQFKVTGTHAGLFPSDVMKIWLGNEASCFHLCYGNSTCFSGLHTLVVDTHTDQLATAVVANNLSRCFVCVSAVAIAAPLIGKIGLCWISVCIAVLWAIANPALWTVLLRARGSK